MPDDQPVRQPVVVTDVRMTFWSMVVFMVKWAIASIPAAIILAAICGLLFATGVAAIGALGKASSATGTRVQPTFQNVQRGI